MSEEINQLIAFEDEMQLTDWVDSPRGAKVTFLLPAEYSAHPFKTFREGTRFFARFLELDDQDQPVNQAKRDEVARAMDKREGRGGRLSREAAMLCKNETFHRFMAEKLFTMDGPARKDLAETFPHSLVSLLKEKKAEAFDDPGHAETLCCYFIYAICGIKSRRELDKATPSGRITAAAQKYHAMIVEPFYQWRIGK